MGNLREIFDLMFKKLETISNKDNFIKEINKRRKRVFDSNKPDSFFYKTMVRDIFNAGMKVSVVTDKWLDISAAFSNFDVEKVSKYDDRDLQNLMSNPKIIRNEKKIRACIKNARRMKVLSGKFGSFGEFLNRNENNLFLLKKKLTSNFRYLGNVLVLDYLKDIGMDIIKPDVHVMRVFFRLDFIDSEERTEANIYRVIRVAENIKRETSEKLAVIDAVFWVYGGGGDKHVTKAICSKKEPLCSECPLANHCRYYNIH